MKPRQVFGILCFALGLFGATSCRREEKPESLASPQPQAVPTPWTWHALGGLLVIEGEVDQPVELLLKGTTLNERRFVEFGPVRWEMYRPRKGEKAELRTREGKLLARWDFDQPSEVTAPPPQLAQSPKIPKPAKPEPKPKRTEPKRPEPKKIEPPKLPPPKPSPKKTEPKKPEPRKIEPAKPQARIPEILTHRPVPPTKTEPEPLPLPPRPTPMPAPTPARSISGFGGTWPGSGEGLNLLRGPRGQRQVCLTFDGGSTSEVALDVLEALRIRGLHCTFFLTGAFIQKFPEIVRHIARDGHEIGNHTQNHPHLAPNGTRDPRWTKERFQQELISADQAFFRLLGRPMDPLWRSPYGEHTGELRKWAEELGYRHVGWSEGADTLDWATVKERRLYRTGNAILDRLHSRMERQDGDGLVVLMHLGSARPAEDRPARVLGPFLDRALANGWRFVNVGSYLQSSGKPAWERDRRVALLTSGGSSASASAQR